MNIFLCQLFSLQFYLLNIPTKQKANKKPTPKLSTLCRLHYQNFVIFNSVQSLSRVQLFATPWTAPCQASLSITNSRSLLKLMSIESAMPSNHLILCHPVLLLPSIFSSIRVFPSVSSLHQVARVLELQPQQQSFQ